MDRAIRWPEVLKVEEQTRRSVRQACQTTGEKERPRVKTSWPTTLRQTPPPASQESKPPENASSKCESSS